ncbi:MAG: maltose alpha-D-glucosyltransferase [Dehalococcoidia bacterium]
MSGITGDPLWYKDAIIYELYVRSFRDTNADGIGDFRGLTEKLDYLTALGVTCVWLLPFYPSPMRDGGYDIADYTGIHPDFGQMREFTRFVREAHRRAIRVITELVVNHTSDQHPWFQRARHAPRGSADRNMYVWSDSDEAYAGTRIIFTDTERSNWAWDPVAGQYYWHRFFSHQPDLNFENPRVIRAVKNYLRFWFEKGVDGLRLDAVPYLCEREGTNNENLPETHAVLKELRAFVDEHFEERMLLAEANQWPTDVRAYFGDGDECHMAFHFPIMPRMFMALHQEDRHPIVDILEQTPVIPDNCQWGLFLRNHDELTLEMVTDEERDYMYQTYATDPRMRVNVGIRRRLTPLLNNSRRAIELLNSLLFSLPGTPILYYGDEIGMGDNVFLGDRDGVRTPMQWSPDRNAGFSAADPQRLYLPVIMDAQYGYQAVNVEAQERSPSSMLNWMRRLIALRRERTVFGRGDVQMLHPANRAVLAFLRTYEEQAVLVVANLSRFVQPVELDLSAFAGMVPTEMIGRHAFPEIGEEPYFLSLGPHTFFWFDLVRRPEPVRLPEPGAPPLTVVGDWNGLFEGEARRRLERDLVPAFLSRQRWYGGKDAPVAHVAIHGLVPVCVGAAPAWMAMVDVAGEGRAVRTYALPLAIATGRAARAVRETVPGAVIGELEGDRGRGVLFDGTASDDVCRALLDLMRDRRAASGADGVLEAEATSALAELYGALEEPPSVHRMAVEQSNTSVRFDAQLILKFIRRVDPGVHPEVEVGRHLTERLRFDHAPRFAGAVHHTSPGEPAATVITLQEFAWNQGDAWSYAVGEARRYLEEEGPVPFDQFADGTQPDPRFADAARVIGTRTAELHLALADARGDAAFAPEDYTRNDLRALSARIRDRLRRLTPALRRIARADDEDAVAASDAAGILSAARGLASRLTAAAREIGALRKIRCHGDYHLGQLLWRRGDFMIVDFEGEVGLPIAERRRKTSVFTDVAGMLRSFQYAALYALREHAGSLPDPALTIERSEPWARRFERRSIERFLEGYYAAAGDAPFLPREAGARDRLLHVYLIDKALHELEYELEHRPAWVAIPLRGVAESLRALDGAGA